MRILIVTPLTRAHRRTQLRDQNKIGGHVQTPEFIGVFIMREIFARCFTVMSDDARCECAMCVDLKCRRPISAVAYTVC